VVTESRGDTAPLGFDTIAHSGNAPAAMDEIKIASRVLAGISVPDTQLISRTIEYARQKCEPYLFNHVVRSWLFAERIGQLQNTEHDAEVVAVGTLLHDITPASSVRAASKWKAPI
jgi:hypothetical protein